MSSLGFSYAQAAKGLAPSSNVSSNPASSASSEHGAKDTNPIVESVDVQPRTSRLQKNEKESALPTKSIQSRPNSSEADATPQNDKAPSQATESVVDDSKSTRSQRSSGDDIVSPSKTTDALPSMTVQSRNNSELSRQEYPEASDEHDKVKEADDDWEKVSIPSSTAERELRAAPIPVVNIWQQRLETQQAKLKEQSGQRQPALTQSQSKQVSQNVPADDAKKKGLPRENSNSELARVSPGRVNSGGRVPRDQRGNSTSPRSVSQQKDPNTVRPPPPVDVASWPTPEGAVTEPGRRSSLLDKVDKNELNDAKPSKKNQWTTLPFVPTVKFETQIPTGRRGGRAANARGGSRGTTGSQGEKNTERAEPGVMGPPPLPKTLSENDRGGKSNNTRPTRDGSVPAESQRDDSTAGRSQANETVATSLGVVTPQAQNLSTNESPSALEAHSSNDPSRSSSRQASANANTNVLNKTDLDQTALQNAEVKETPTRQSNRPEKHTSTSFDNPRSTNETGDRPAKEWSKDRPNKQEGWRSEQRGDRAERGRGAYRGRGNRAGYVNVSYTTPLPQNGFEANKPSNTPDSRSSRQPSQNFGSASFGSNRNPPRAHSIPVGMIPGAYFSPPQMFSQGLSPIQTDVGYNGYNQIPNGISNGIMSAMPYNEQLNGFALISMVSRQLEYYFSLDNLCKDMFLRKNMDSQGFVLLRVIADFRRIKSLLGEGSMSFDNLKSVAAQVPNTDYVVGEDGEDRLRSRGNWKDFVLPMEERVPQAQNDGPQIKPNQHRQHVNIAQDFHMSNGLRSAPPTMNGFQDTFANHHPGMHYPHGLVAEPQAVEQWSGRAGSPQPEERRISVTSPVSKVRSPSHESTKGFFGTMTNGHRDSMSSNAPGKENTFPDESVALLKVVVKNPDYQGREETIIMDDPVPARSSGLRGGAGSPEQFERVRSLQFGQNPVLFKKSTDQAMYFTQGEGPRPELMRPGYIHEDYMTLREQAYNQRAENHFGGALLVLYPLWADFLAVPHQFNVGMYEEFKTWALEDAEKGNDNGKKYLVKFYDAMLGSNNAMTERISNDIIRIARAESGSNRRTWAKLRGAWRNGATNLKTRKRLADLLTAEEREELDRNS